MNQDELKPEKYRTDLAIVRETAEQLIRDAETFGGTVIFSGNPFTAYEELRQQLIAMLLQWKREDSSKMQAFMYRVDLPEGRYRKALAGNSPIEELATLVLEREFQKVLIRRYFRDTKSDGPLNNR